MMDRGYVLHDFIVAFCSLVSCQTRSVASNQDEMKQSESDYVCDEEQDGEGPGRIGRS